MLKQHVENNGARLLTIEIPVVVAIVLDFCSKEGGKVFDFIRSLYIAKQCDMSRVTPSWYSYKRYWVVYKIKQYSKTKLLNKLTSVLPGGWCGQYLCHARTRDILHGLKFDILNNLQVYKIT